MNKHRTDLVSLVGGVIFLGVVGTWALERVDLLDGFRGWLLPLLLIGVGLIGLIGIRPRRQGARAEDSARADWTADEAGSGDAPEDTTSVGSPSAADEVKDG